MQGVAGGKNCFWKLRRPPLTPICGRDFPLNILKKDSEFQSKNGSQNYFLNFVRLYLHPQSSALSFHAKALALMMSCDFGEDDTCPEKS